MIRFRVATVLLVAILCEIANPSFASTQEKEFKQVVTPIPEVHAYLEEALNVLEQYSVRRNEICWATFREEVFQSAKGASCPAETYEAIRIALDLLGDHHSVFLTPNEVEKYKDSKPRTIKEIEGFLIEDQIAYLKIPSFASFSAESMNEYASKVQNIICKLDTNQVNKWIIDLRGNNGGNMAPMLLGLAPFLDKKSIEMAFGVEDPNEGAVLYNGSSIKFEGGDFDPCVLSSTPYHIKNPSSPIAILLDEKTASSGEAVAIAFLGKEHTRTFGQHTGGYTSGNSPFFLSDRALICLSVSYMRDRLGRVYKEGVVPDVIIEDEGAQIIHSAVEWLKQQEHN